MELLDIYDDMGNNTGKIITRGDKNIVLGHNEHIAVAVIFIRNNQGLYLMQKTSVKKGGEYSSTGGHVNSGETPLQAIKREVMEELGIDISNDRIIDYGYLLYDQPIRYMFYLEKNIDINDIRIQISEVEYAKYMTENEINQLIINAQITHSHGIMFNEILRRRKNNK